MLLLLIQKENLVHLIQHQQLLKNLFQLLQQIFKQLLEMKKCS